MGNTKADGAMEKELFLLSKTQNHISLYSFHQQEAIRNHQNFIAKYLKDQCIAMNIKQYLKIKMQQISIDILSNHQTL